MFKLTGPTVYGLGPEIIVLLNKIPFINVLIHPFIGNVPTKLIVPEYPAIVALNVELIKSIGKKYPKSTT
jgi:hypothetical protein